MVISRMGIAGKATMQDIVSLVNTYDASSFIQQSDNNYIYQSWEKTNGTGYLSQRISLENQTISEATGLLPVPADLSSLTYV